jgi:hypothetical protein
VPRGSLTFAYFESTPDRSFSLLFSNCLAAAGLSELDIDLLMNHSLPGVNAGYITRDRLLKDHLRQQQQRISGLVVDGPEVKRDPSLIRWLRSAKGAEIASQAERGVQSETASIAA